MDMPMVSLVYNVMRATDTRSDTDGNRTKEIFGNEASEDGTEHYPDGKPISSYEIENNSRNLYFVC
jgi:hypothetical protein